MTYTKPLALMDTRPVDIRTAAAIEGAEVRAWADLVAAAPRDFAEEMDLRARTVAGGSTSYRYRGEKLHGADGARHAGGWAEDLVSA